MKFVLSETCTFFRVNSLTAAAAAAVVVNARKRGGVVRATMTPLVRSIYINVVNEGVSPSSSSVDK